MEKSQENYIIFPGESDRPDLLVSLYLKNYGDHFAKGRRNLDDGSFLLSLENFRQFLKFLINGKGVFDGLGRNLSHNECRLILNGIIGNSYPIRGEFLNQVFSYQVNSWQTIYNDINKGETLIKKIDIPASKYLGIHQWLNNATSCGLPQKDSSLLEELLYKQPTGFGDKGTIFYSNSFCANLDCSVADGFSHPGIGFRPVKIKK